MANKNPVQTAAFKAQQVPKYGDKALGKPICVRYLADIDEILRDLPNRQEFIRNAVASALIEQGLLDTYGDSTHKDKINQLLNDADRVKTLEAKVIELERQLKAMSNATTTAKPELEPNLLGTDWSQVPSAELKGSQAPGSAEEKIRRAIEAIRAYNEGKELSQMYRLSEANVRYLSGSRHGTIKAYFAANPELNDYNTSYGFTVQHDRGKTPIAEVIEW
ncbi:hypothetical protein D0962_35175 [Leptolyngbyaceae cyanobacterium CCMR0082]|uniref:Uncharacterized protein n=1 Tax=Adonisia turfae CCMR0082 TaxID=2304604 RepID=A0A6M0SHT9_9CYAN|nr:hypothetical protein [Adonisia turfae]MDV3348187.1 hypothetical protein [Leptothoe sp. LEGE 181152]NEZ67924.1 hypothetical protein [Adonisia turfae CCMR0082]